VEVAACRTAWERRGLPIVALQALLFGRSDLSLFGDTPSRQRLFEHLAAIIDLAAGLGARRLVFGSPKQRVRGALGLAEAEAIAIEFFRELWKRAADRGVWLCIEGNPVQYGCDFLVDSQQVIGFVAQVHQRGLGVHLDTGGMKLAGESPASVIAAAGPSWRHVHASEPHLVPLGEGGVDHAAVAAALRAVGYAGYVSVEMVQGPAGTSWRERLERALTVATRSYGHSAAIRSNAA